MKNETCEYSCEDTKPYEAFICNIIDVGYV